MALQLGRKNARRLAVQAQLIHATRPADLVELVDRLTLLQIDPTAAIAPNADQVPGVDSKSHTSPPSSPGCLRSGAWNSEPLYGP